MQLLVVLCGKPKLGVVFLFLSVVLIRWWSLTCCHQTCTLAPWLVLQGIVDLCVYPSFVVLQCVPQWIWHQMMRTLLLLAFWSNNQSWSGWGSVQFRSMPFQWWRYDGRGLSRSMLVCDSVTFRCRCIFWLLFGGVVVYRVAPFIVQARYVRVVRLLLGSHLVVSILHLVQVSIHSLHSLQVSLSWCCIEAAHCGDGRVDVDLS